MNLMEKLTILSDAAKYDVSCSSSGSTRRGEKGSIGSAAKAGICHSFTADGRCISLLKILMTNNCIYDCAYCLNRKSNDNPRAAFTVDEVVSLTMNFYRRNYIEGLFLSSAIIGSPDYTMEQLIKIVEKLRYEEHFYGYIHLKAIPGANPMLIQRAGELADRLSVNLELPSEQSLSMLAPDKTRQSILQPMHQIHQGIMQHKQHKQHKPIKHNSQSAALPDTMQNVPTNLQSYNKSYKKTYQEKALFVPAGQTTQMMVGASGESDLQMLQLTLPRARQKPKS
ncbi:MAG: putative DNA modification/repair radical SAM protein, partial [Peptococcaceae bacterium]|nr:putative DNA modification/repair radical SAM protein [Peptococcaceae bacterium]